jgi:hypothetical protein
MTSKKSGAPATGKDTVPAHRKASPMTYETVNLPPRVIAGREQDGDPTIAEVGEVARESTEEV